ncbi:MAG: C4-dicarboxylate ABC transporter permease [Deltaproteobacteria bacterium HGW-Deltaproteobacteria-12]|jgi:tripartite ATP-independent transporter DctM subunit|nr:MAG: C4-dicarboxylate ABC transporter permease [Deltaproteobacteria bacterium HGW-Deltaproteobacteria-12]
MDPLIVGVAGILMVLLFLLLGMNVGFAMGTVGFLGFSLLTSFGTGISMIGMVAYKTGSSYTLTVIPLFILMGLFSNSSRMGYELYQAVNRWIGFLPGGLAMATVLACAAFAAISGSSLATAAIMGMVALPEMKRFNYDNALAIGCVAAGGTLGILIPPSTIMIIYGLLTEQPIGTLFIAGILPGILLTCLFLGTIYIMTKRNPLLAPAGPSFPWRDKFSALKGTASVLFLFALVIGGLYMGWFSPTEAAGVGAFGALIVALVKRRMTGKDLFAALQETALTTAMVFTILIGANILGYFMTVSQIPESLSRLIVSQGLNRYLVMSIICTLYIILGCLMEGMAIMVLTLPVVFPLVMQLGFDPIWFGVIVTLFIEMGLITPPIGVNVFIVGGIVKEVPMYAIFRGVMPFFIAMIICLIILMVFPQIALFLPRTMGR